MLGCSVLGPQRMEGKQAMTCNEDACSRFVFCDFRYEGLIERSRGLAARSYALANNVVAMNVAPVTR